MNDGNQGLIKGVTG